MVIVAGSTVGDSVASQAKFIANFFLSSTAANEVTIRTIEVQQSIKQKSIISGSCQPRARLTGLAINCVTTEFEIEVQSEWGMGIRLNCQGKGRLNIAISGGGGKSVWVFAQ